MATLNSTAAQIAPFRTKQEEHCILDCEAQAPALIFNPKAGLASVLGAAAARADNLHRALFFHAIGDSNGEATAADIASVLEPLAEELDLIIQHLQRMVDPTAGAPLRPLISAGAPPQ